MLQSPPSRRRGLKFYEGKGMVDELTVASFSEAWIEILTHQDDLKRNQVASFSEAWIEIVILLAFLRVFCSRLLLGGVD